MQILILIVHYTSAFVKIKHLSAVIRFTNKCTRTSKFDFRLVIFIIVGDHLKDYRCKKINMHIKSILIHSIQSAHGICLHEHKLYFPTLYYGNWYQIPSLSAFSWTSNFCMFRSITLPLQIRINSTENWNFDRKKDKLQDTTFWILKKVLLSHMETNLNFVLMAQFYIPKRTKFKCSSILAWNKIVALKSPLDKTLQLMYAYTY